MKLVIFGANGPTGRQAVRQALAEGHQVGAVTRNPGVYPLRAPDLTILGADVFDGDAVDRAIAGTDAVISCYGVPYTRQPVTVYSHGIRNILAAMTHRRVARLVCVSSTGVSSDETPGETILYRKIVVPFFRHVLGRTLYGDMRRMEEIVCASDRAWTIVRPAGLFNAIEPSADPKVGPPRLRGRMTSRADLARFLIQEATQPRHLRETVEIVTRSGAPSAASFLRSTFARHQDG